MGIATGDFDRDGSLDFCVTNYWDQPTNLFLQRNQGYFIDFAARYGLSQPSRDTVGFGIQASDFDRDGWLDLAVLNGHVFDPAENGTPEIPFKMTPQFFRGSGAGFNLDLETIASDPFWTRTTLGRTLALTDFNRDGRPDLVANHLDASADILENQMAGGRWLRLNIVGVTSEREAIGTRVVATAGDETWTAWMIGGDGFQCSNEPTIDIGVADHEIISKLEIVWPSGLRQLFDDVPTNQHYLVVENETELNRLPHVTEHNATSRSK